MQTWSAHKFLTVSGSRTILRASRKLVVRGMTPPSQVIWLTWLGQPHTYEMASKAGSLSICSVTRRPLRGSSFFPGSRMRYRMVFSLGKGLYSYRGEAAALARVSSMIMWRWKFGEREAVG